MINDVIVNELVGKIKEGHKLDNLNLVEKTVGNKLKFTFSNKLSKVVFELKLADVASFIYANFFPEELKKEISFIEFSVAYDAIDIDENADVETVCNEIVDKIKNEKLF